MTFRFNLGDRVKDKITGYSGIVMCCTVYLNGCKRYEVQPEKLGKEGEIQEPAFLDEAQLEQVKPTAKAIKKKDTGGPQKPPLAVGTYRGS